MLSRPSHGWHGGKAALFSEDNSSQCPHRQRFLPGLYQSKRLLLLTVPFCTAQGLTHSRCAKNSAGQKQVYSCEYAKEFILVLLFVSHCINFHSNNCKPALPHPVCSERTDPAHSSLVQAPVRCGPLWAPEHCLSFAHGLTVFSEHHHLSLSRVLLTQPQPEALLQPRPNPMVEL